MIAQLGRYLYSPAKGRFFELFATIQTVSEFEETDIIFGNLVYKVPACAQLTQREFVVIFVIQYVHERG